MNMVVAPTAKPATSSCGHRRGGNGSDDKGKQQGTETARGEWRARPSWTGS